jgi:hypothetical protein
LWHLHLQGQEVNLFKLPDPNDGVTILWIVSTYLPTYTSLCSTTPESSAIPLSESKPCKIPLWIQHC